jgi:hypothetical protein
MRYSGGTCPWEALQKIRKKTGKITQQIGHILLKVNKQSKFTSLSCPTWAETNFW